jgi:ABC-type glycerol-3-phosphate transport system permease component
MRSSISIPRTAILVLLAIPFLYPFVFLASTAFKTPQDYANNQLGLPTAWTLDNLRNAWVDADLGRALLNSAFTVTLSILILVPVCSAAAFWFLRHDGRLTRLLMYGLFAFWSVPFIVYAVPLYVGVSRLHLLDNLVVLSVLYATVNMPFGVYLLHSYYQKGIPPECLESAAIDGASTMRTLMSIVIPLSKPAIGTLAALSFVWVWGDLIIAAFMMQTSEKFTMTLASATLVTQQENNLLESAGAALMALIPVLTVFLLAQRAISRGTTTGAVR